MADFSRDLLQRRARLRRKTRTRANAPATVDLLDDVQRRIARVFRPVGVITRELDRDVHLRRRTLHDLQRIPLAVVPAFAGDQLVDVIGGDERGAIGKRRDGAAGEPDVRIQQRVGPRARCRAR